MLREQLTSRQDLIESLDSEPIFDYLIQHGVLDPERRNDICQEVNRVKRNTALLKHLDDIGQTATALLINALRQSGQLHLASSLDVTHRIRPTSGKGYHGKPRHKGEVTIRIEVDSINAQFPVWEEGDPLEEKHGDTPEKEFKLSGKDEVHIALSPRRAHKSYENMTMIGESEKSPRTWKIREYAYDSEDSDSGKTSCWCFCRSKRKGKTKQKRKPAEKYEMKVKKESLTHLKTDMKSSPSRTPEHSVQSSRTVSSTSKTLKPVLQMQNKSPSKDSSAVMSTNPRGKLSGSLTTMEVSPSKSLEMREIQINSENQVNNGNNMVKYKNNVNDRKKNGNKKKDKENTPPVIIEPNVMTPPTKHTTTDNGCKRSLFLDVCEDVEICEMWKGYGQTFKKHVEHYFELLDNTLNMEIIKYFEQDRGTLVLQVFIENALVVCNICMKPEQLNQLQDDNTNSELLNVFEKILLNQSIFDEMGIKDMRLKVVIDENEVELAKSELSGD